MKNNVFVSKLLDKSEVNFLRNNFNENKNLDKINDLVSFLLTDTGKTIFNYKLFELIKKNLEIENFIFLDVVKIFKRTSKSKIDTGWHTDFGGTVEKKKNY